MTMLQDVPGLSLLAYIIPFLIVLTVVVFIHELGHFLVARWNGVRVDAFSIGFGPELLAFNDRHGTRWRFAAIPLGGYVKFFGDASAASDPDFAKAASMSAEERSVSFLHKPVWRRALIVAAGPIANFLLAIVIFTVLFAFIGKTVTDPVVTAVEPGSAAAEAGFQPGDVVRSIDGEAIRYFSDIPMIVGPRPGQPLAVGIERGGQALTLNATPRLETRTDRFGNRIEMGLLGLRSDADQANLRTISFSPGEAFVEGLNETWTIVVRSLGMVKELFTGRQSVTQLSGPVGIAKASGDVWTLGARAVFHWIAFLSVSIGLLNLFPIPMLDGGHLVFYAIEAARGRPVGENAQEVAFRIGLSALLLLMVVALWNDIARLTDRLGGLLS